MTQYAWKIYDEIDDRVILTLSSSEADHWDGLRYVDVTIISWKVGSND